MFREKIQKLVDRLDGGVGAVLMGFDGIAVDSYTRPPRADAAPLPDIQTIGMEFAHLISQARRGAQSLEIGDIREITIRTDRLTVLIQALNKDYFLACGILASGANPNVGKARYLLRMTVPQLAAEL
jgi:predicted regulator of Ras-like GTPase activity (Roadblock/LC7/MglB family)